MNAKNESYVPDLYFGYMEVVRHWDPMSEKYAGGDCLLTALDNGWQMSGVVFCEEFWHSGTRRVPVYHFELLRGEETMRMPVIRNPYVEYVIRDAALEVRPLGERIMARTYA